MKLFLISSISAATILSKENASTTCAELTDTRRINLFNGFDVTGTLPNNHQYTFDIVSGSVLWQRLIGGKQTSYKLGAYSSATCTDSGWIIEFKNGHSCGNLPPRRATMTLVCGDRDHVFAVDEPQTCVYTLSGTLNCKARGLSPGVDFGCDPGFESDGAGGCQESKSIDCAAWLESGKTDNLSYCENRPAGHYAHPDCSKFYHCHNRHTAVKNCAPGTLYSSSLQVCVWPDQSDCVACVE